MEDFEGSDAIAFLSLASLLSTCQRQHQVESNDADSDTESIGSEDWDVNSDNDSTTPHQLSRLTTKEKQLKKLLDRIAETFSREKTVPFAQAKRNVRRQGNTNGKGSSHVTASGLVRLNDEPTVYVAKNGSVDSTDKGLAKSLTVWFRAVAATGKQRAIEKDVMWAKLVEYSKQRLDIYATQIKSSSISELGAVFGEGSDGGVLARELHSLSAKYGSPESSDILQRMVSVAYQLRYEPAPTTMTFPGRKLRSSVCFLGRLRAAFETFKECAIAFRKSFKDLTVVCLQAPAVRLVSRSEIERRVDLLAKKHGVSRPKKGMLLNTIGKAAEVLIPCHAEIQLLIYFECSLPADGDPFPYFGCSKKSCWLCHQLLSRYKDRRGDRKGFYQTRSSHGQLYPRWHLSLAAYPQADPRIRFNLLAALMDIENLMVDKLLAVPRTQLPAVAESSANITVAGGVLKRRALAKLRLAESSADSPTRAGSDNDNADILKDFVCSRLCVRIPATGETPHLVPIKFYNHRHPSLSLDCIPDFGAYWKAYTFEHVHRRVEQEAHEAPELDGKYFLYWCRTAELPPNLYLMSMLDITSLQSDEHFWHGDVFITRFHNDDEGLKFLWDDVPSTILDFPWIEEVIRSFWDSKEPEIAIRELQECAAMQEKTDADRQIILGRMTSSERKIIKLMPEVLSMLVFTACDDGAYVDVSAQPSKTDPKMIEVRALRRVTAMEERGWKGFSTADL